MMMASGEGRTAFAHARALAESFEVVGHGKSAAMNRAREALERVHIADPDSVMDRYPYQLSGGMLQRVVIASNVLKALG